MRLLLVRHGATFENEQKRYLGQIDVPLSPLGAQQAARLGEYLAREPVDAIVSSDLVRARDTASAIARYHSVSVVVDSDLREIARGVWEGATYAEVKSRYADLLKKWRRAPAQCQIPGGETLGQVRDRAVRALERSHSRAPDGLVVWVTHTGVIQVLLCYLLEVDLNSWRQFRRDNGSLTPVQVYRVHERLIGSIETPLFPSSTLLA
jgi:broad specificity phosphatase PhoE